MHPLAVVLPLLAALAGAPLSEPAPGPAPRNQFLARAASDGESYLALWIDDRSSVTGTFATRISRDGEVLDPNGIAISEEKLYFPQMIWAGSSYLITWSTRDQFWLMRIGRDGAIVDGPRVLMNGATPVDAASDGRLVVVSYLKSNGIAPEPHALFLTPEAEIVADVKLADAREIGGPDIAFNGTTFAAVWLDVTGAGSNIAVDGVRFTIDGAGPVLRLVSDPTVRAPKLESDGRDFLLLTYDDDLVRHTARSVRADLTTIGAPVLLPDVFYGNVSLLWTGSHYAVVGDSVAKISAVRLDRDGRVLGEAATIEQVPFTGSSVAATATTNARGELYVAWAGSPAGTANALDVFGTVVNAGSLAPRARTLLSRAPARQERPAIAAGNTSMLTVWQEQSGVYARRHALDGRPLDAAPLRLAEKGFAVTTAFSGTDFIVAWVEEGALVTRRIPVAGALRAEAGTRFNVDNIHLTLALGAARGTTLLVWASGSGVHAVRLRDDATFVDTLPLTLTSLSTARKVTIAAGGEEFLVAWDETFFQHHAGELAIGVHAARVTRGLTNLGTFTVSEDESVEEGDPAAAWNGREWLIVWTSGSDIRGRRVLRNGTFRDMDPLLVARDAVLPALAWQDGYVLAWTEAPPPQWRAQELRTGWLSDLGAPLTAVRALGDTEPESAQSAVIAPLGAGRVATVFTRLAVEAGGVPRAFLETFGPPRRRSVRH